MKPKAIYIFIGVMASLCFVLAIGSLVSLPLNSASTAHLNAAKEELKAFVGAASSQVMNAIRVDGELTRTEVVNNRVEIIENRNNSNINKADIESTVNTFGFLSLMLDIAGFIVVVMLILFCIYQLNRIVALAGGGAR